METPARDNVVTHPAASERGEAAPAPRIPPHNFEIEMGLLAALLANNRAFERVGEILEPDHFADGRHGRIYAAIRKGFTPEINAVSTIIILLSMAIMLITARFYKFGGEQ